MQHIQFAAAAFILLTAPLSQSEASTSTNSVNSSTPWFCHEYECAPYTVIDRNADYETRQYSAGETLAPPLSVWNASYTGVHFPNGRESLCMTCI